MRVLRPLYANAKFAAQMASLTALFPYIARVFEPSHFTEDYGPATGHIPKYVPSKPMRPLNKPPYDGRAGACEAKCVPMTAVGHTGGRLC